MAVPSYAFVALINIPTTNIDATLTNYPVMVKIVSTDATLSGFLTALSSGSGVTANRKKISVQTIANAECYVDIVYTSSTDFYFWVKIPSVSHSSATQFYVCADASKSENTTYVGDTGSSAAQNVWTGYHAVYNYNQTPSAGGTITDATGNGYNLTIHASTVPTLTSSPVGRSYAWSSSASMASNSSAGMNLEGDFWSCEALHKASSVSREIDYIVNQNPQSGCSFVKTRDDISIVHQKTSGTEVSLIQESITGFDDWKYYGCNTDDDLDYTAWAAYYGSTKYTSATMTNGTGTRYNYSSFAVGKSNSEGGVSYFAHLRITTGANKSDAWHKANHYNFSNSLFTASVVGVTVYQSAALTQTISIPGGSASYSTSYAQAAAITQARTVNDPTITTATNPFNAPLLTLRKTLITGTRLANIGRFAVNFSSKRPNVEFRIRE